MTQSAALPLMCPLTRHAQSAPLPILNGVLSMRRNSPVLQSISAHLGGNSVTFGRGKDQMTKYQALRSSRSAHHLPLIVCNDLFTDVLLNITDVCSQDESAGFNKLFVR